MEPRQYHFTAHEGKVFKRKSDGMVFGKELHLGYAYYIGGEKLAEPILERIEDYEEIEEEE